MYRTASVCSRTVRVCVLGLATIACAVVFTATPADARRKHRSHAKVSSYSPAYAAIIVDANSGATLTANNADALRHPASLTKIMTLYLLFEKLESGKMKLDTEMPVSEYASRQAPTKLGLRPGQTLTVEDAIKGLVTRSANDASVVIAEAIAGDEQDFAKMMTRKARALGMSRTVYRNANGLPDSDQVTTARDQSILGRAIQDRFPRYYRYFATSVFHYHGRAIRNHNRLLGSVEGVDGIKTGYTRASGFNLVTSMKRGNRHLVGVVLGGRSGGARDAAMRSLLAQNLEQGATRRTVAAITERGAAEANAEVAEVEAVTRPTRTVQVNGAVQVASAVPDAVPLPARAAPVAPRPSKPEPAPLNSGVIQTQPIAAIPGSSEPMKPVRVRTVQVKAAPVRLAAAGAAPAGSAVTTSAIPAAPQLAETSGSVLPKSDLRAEMPPQPANHGTGRGLLGVLPASSQTMASLEPAARPTQPAQPVQALQQNGAIKPVAVHTGWIIQVGALESESEARARLDVARDQAHGMLGKADPFTEPVLAKGSKRLYRARFAGLDRDQAEAVCRTLKRSDISCIAIKN